MKLFKAIFWMSLWWLPVFGWAQKIPPAAYNTPSLKLAPILQSHVLESHVSENKVSSYRLQVTDAVAFVKWQRENLPEANLSKATGLPNTFTMAKINARNLQQLIDCPFVVYIDGADRIPHEELILNNADLTANAVEAVHTRFPELNGFGLVASVKENPFDTADIDLQGRIIRSAALRQPANAHATTMATLLAGAGNSAPGGKGVAWQARLFSSDFTNLFPDDEQTLRAANVSVQNHSYGVSIENYYGLEAQAYDRQCVLYPELVHVFSAGNAGTEALTTGIYAGLTGWANLTGQFKLSKNTLSVGATDTAGQVSVISSRGPAYDGRVKPELVAFGEGGTSESAALVSGIALLVQQAYQQQHANTLPPASLVKAALINSANDLNRPQVDYETGFGQANALGAVQTMQQNRFFTGQIASQEIQSFTIPVPDRAQLLKITLVWHDREGSPSAPQALVNDLDLTLEYTPTHKTWQPWVLSPYPHPDSLRLPARRRADHLNNIEQITVAAPAAGSYKVLVRGYNIPQGPQRFSLVYEVQQDLTWTYPNIGSNLTAGAKNRLRWQGPTQAGTGQLEYRSLPDGDWQLISESVALNKTYFDWQTPDEATVAQLRLTIKNKTILSDSFLVARPLLLTGGYNCGSEAMLFWPKEEGVDEYQVWRLGATTLEPLIRTTDTVLIINKNQQPAVKYAVAPVVNGFTGANSTTVDLNQIDCYVKSFLPRQLVTDTVTFDLELSTFYGIQSLALERLESGAFKSVQSIDMVKGVYFVFTDPAPRPGRNNYRVRIVNLKQEVYYSQTEAIIFTEPDFLQLFPNPVTQGQELNIVVESDEPSPIYLYDRLGRILAAYNESGVIKTISTAGLRPGVYLVQVQTPTGKLITSRLVVL